MTHYQRNDRLIRQVSHCDDDHGRHHATPPNSSDVANRLCSPPSQLSSGGAGSERHDSRVPAILSRETKGRKERGVMAADQEEDDFRLVTEGFETISADDRNQALDDLHGVTKPIEENPDFVRGALDQLEVEISKIGSSQRSAYDKALFLNPNYCQGKDFRLMFLRSERFDSTKAALRMMRYFDLKLKLFGYKCLARDVTFKDLDPEAQEIFMTGREWFLNQHDRSGRRIYLVTPGRSELPNPVSFLRQYWYSLMLGAADRNTQVRGAVLMIFNGKQRSSRNDEDQTGLDHDGNEDSYGGGAASSGNVHGIDTLQQSADTDLKTILELVRLFQAIPIFWGSCHFCLREDDETSSSEHCRYPLLGIQMALDSLRRAKLRIHRGSRMKLKCGLLGYGIMLDWLPLDPDGCLIGIDKFKEHVEKRIVMEEAVVEARTSTNSHQNTFDFPPSDADVLMGRGCLFQDFPGTVRFRQLVEERRPMYERSRKKDKIEIIMEVINTVKAMGGKFLKKEMRNDGPGRVWVVADAESIRRKVSNAFQTRQRTSKSSEAADTQTSR